MAVVIPPQIREFQFQPSVPGVVSPQAPDNTEARVFGMHADRNGRVSFAKGFWGRIMRRHDGAARPSGLRGPRWDTLSTEDGDSNVSKICM